MVRGSLCISIDVELAWGIWDKPSAAYHARCAEREAAIVDALVALFERHRISATWAIVGRLLELDDAAAATTSHGARIWYAPELVERVRGARTPQDIGSHSYAHVYFGATSREALRADLAAARRVHDRHRLPFVSFVFPRNQVAHIDLLREAGVRVFRSVDHGWHAAVRQRLGAGAGRFANLADKMLPIPPAVVHPIIHHVDGEDVVELPSSMLLMARNGLRRAVHPASVVAKARLGLAAARRTGGAFHLWFHPSNFYYDMERQLASLGDIVEAAARMREAGQIEIRPMSSFVRAA
jgi:peptidoglycan/xylan/chitin deacetylase (PgdA/CDA1 family)